MNKRHTTAIGLVLLWLFLLRVFVPTVSAQDDVPSVGGTTFQTSCYSDLTEVDAHIHIKYASDVVEHYKVTTNAPGTNIPADLTTQIGTYELGWVLYTVDAQLTVTFTNDDGVAAELPIIISELQEGECIPVVPYTPDYDAPVYTTPACPATAVNQGTGETYCYIPQPNGVVPIPPPPQ